MVAKKKSKFAQSGIIITVLLVLIVIIAVGIYAGFIKKQVGSLSEDDISAEALTAVYTIKEANLSFNNILSFKVNRPNGKGNLTAFRFSVKNASGSVYDWSNTTYLPGEFETYEYSIDLTGKINNPQTISLIPVYGTKLGLEANAKIIVNTSSPPDFIVSCDNCNKLIAGNYYKTGQLSNGQPTYSNNNGYFLFIKKFKQSSTSKYRAIIDKTIEENATKSVTYNCYYSNMEFSFPAIPLSLMQFSSNLRYSSCSGSPSVKAYS